MSDDRPSVVFFNINGAGLGHMSTCLAYAHRLRTRARSIFFSLASAVEKIHEMGFEADYFVSPSWSRTRHRYWTQQLAYRLGLLLERVRPQVLVFDGTWPSPGLLHAAAAHGLPHIVWSDLTMYREDMHPVPVSESCFDLVIRLGEIGGRFSVDREARPGRRVTVPPVTLLRDDELLDRSAARAALGLDSDGRHALVCLGAGNLDDPSDVARGLTEALRERGFDVAYARAPISVRDVSLPPGVRLLELYPLARYLRAFDVFAGAAGYNTCCEVVQSGVPSLLVPNTSAADDQTRRAAATARHARVCVSPCRSRRERVEAVDRLLSLAEADIPPQPPLDGADRAAEEILALCDRGTTR